MADVIDAPQATADQGAAASPSWRDRLPVHPAAARFPRPSAEEADELAADIEHHSMLHRVSLWRDPELDRLVLLDGITRLDIRERLGLPIFDDAGQVLPEVGEIVTGDPVAFIISSNILRRHLGTEDRKHLAAELLRADPAQSDRAISNVVHLSDKTVNALRAELTARAEIPHVEVRADTRGRWQRATKPKQDPKAKPRAKVNPPPLQPLTLAPRQAAAGEAVRAGTDPAIAVADVERRLIVLDIGDLAAAAASLIERFGARRAAELA
jgi:hypothetical protein